MGRKAFGAAKRRVGRRGAARLGFGTRHGRFEMLESRRMLAITATFAPATGALSVFGDSADNVIEISRNVGGAILVNNGAVPIIGGAPTVANTTLIHAFGLGGNDTITINETNGALPKAHLFGGSGEDVLTGGSGEDLVFGQSGHDVMFGRGGQDFLFGGSGNDTATGGDADDLVFGQSGNDRFVWNSGDDTDLNEGGAGADTVEVNGGNGAETFTTTANGTRVRFDRLDPAPFSIDIGTTENLVLYANGGNDSFSATGNLAALISIIVDGGPGDDTLLGSNGNDQLLGGDDNDFIDGQQGNDLVFLGAGDDVFTWDPGDGNDIVEGQDGFDKFVMNGSAGSETFELSANGTRTRLTRNLGNVVQDVDGVERFDVNAGAGTDTFIMNNLAGTAAAIINLSLASVIGGTIGDGAADAVIVNCTSGEDVVFISGGPNGTSVFGLAAVLNIAVAEPANDRLTVNALGGDDVIDATSVAAGAIALTLDGGLDDDALLGGDGADVLLGGDGDDVLLGGPGLDILDGGAGDNVVIQ